MKLSLFTLLALPLAINASPSCVDDDGNEVDWFVAMKLVRISTRCKYAEQSGISAIMA
jgi:hypothetical protein